MRLLGLAMGLLGLVTSTARAHIDLLSPSPRHTQQKDGPCGVEVSEPGPVVARYRAGDTIEIMIDETVDHPSHYRVLLDPDGGDDDLPDPICVENCDDRRQPTPIFREEEGVVLLGVFEDEAASTQTLRVTLPTTACAHCTLQVTQVMYDKRPYAPGDNDLYYRCADIEIYRDEPSDAGAVDAAIVDAGVRDASVRDGSVRDGSTDGNGVDAGSATMTAGCHVGPVSVSGRGRSNGLLLAVGLGWILLRRRRRKRKPCS